LPKLTIIKPAFVTSWLINGLIIRQSDGPWQIPIGGLGRLPKTLKSWLDVFDMMKVLVLKEAGKFSDDSMHPNYRQAYRLLKAEAKNRRQTKATQ
jgi:hypothetical protein